MFQTRLGRRVHGYSVMRITIHFLCTPPSTCLFSTTEFRYCRRLAGDILRHVRHRTVLEVPMSKGSYTATPIDWVTMFATIDVVVEGKPQHTSEARSSYHRKRGRRCKKLFKSHRRPRATVTRETRQRSLNTRREPTHTIFTTFLGAHIPLIVSSQDVPLRAQAGQMNLRWET